MTRVHKILQKWIEKNFVPTAVKLSYPSDDRVTITDRLGVSMTVTLNIYCDVMEVDTKKLLAVSDLPHDLDKIGNALPTGWTEIPYR